jgi:hypothetical protein
MKAFRHGLLAIVAAVAANAARAQAPSLPAGLDKATQASLEQVIDSARTLGLPVQPLYAKVAEGKLKQASDAQIVTAVRSLAGRFRELRSELGATLDAQGMSAAATALQAGIPLHAIRDLRDAAAGSRDPAADLAGALVAATDLVAQRVSASSAVTSVQSLLARRATPEQYVRLRAAVSQDIAAGRSPDQAARSTTEAIVKILPPTPLGTIKPPAVGDELGAARVPSGPVTMRN